jgi:hypothetical protein
MRLVDHYVPSDQGMLISLEGSYEHLCCMKAGKGKQRGQG